MYTMSRVRRFVAKIKKNEMFTTRQLLAFGKRNPIDQATCKLVRDGVIIRITYGVFVIAGSDLSLITPEAVATVKAQAFNRQIVEHASDTSKRLSLHGPSNKGPTFATRARSSSIKLVQHEIRLYFKGVSARKFVLADSYIGDILRSLWNLGEKSCTAEAVDRGSSLLSRSQRAQLPDYARLMPQWLYEQFAFARR